MTFKPANCAVRVQEYPLSTIAVFKGQALSWDGTPGAAGYLTSSALTSVIPVVAVSCVDQNGIITGRSALASTTTDNDHKILAYPAGPETRFLAVCSSTPVVAMLDIAWNCGTQLVENETTAEAQFIIESIVDAEAKTVLGRFVSGIFSTRVALAPGA